MKKIIVSIFVIGCLLTSSLASVNALEKGILIRQSQPSGPPETHDSYIDVYVDDNNTEGPWDGTLEHPFQTIQEAIDYVSKGDKIYVFSGIYHEHVDVYKSIDLVGEDKDTTFIDGSGFDYVVQLSADSVNINGFTLQNSDGRGIYLNSDYNTISGNIIKNNNGVGIGKGDRETSDYNTIVDNTITDNEAGIDVLYPSEGYIISNNTIENTKYQGIVLDGTLESIVTGNTITNFNLNNGGDRISGIMLFYQTNNNTISGNTVKNSAYKCIGIFLYMECCYNNIVGNTITGHKWGINLEHGSSYNNISENIITNNIEDGIYLRASMWHNGDLRNNVFLGNTITNNNRGIHLNSQMDDSIYDNTISENIITDNTYGIYFDSGLYNGKVYDNTISRNNITNNDYGIQIKSSNDNKIYHNNFIGNNKNAYDTGTNNWDNGSFGNYWDDYKGIDILKPWGIGDTPYYIRPHICGNKDNYPLMRPWSNPYSFNSNQASQKTISKAAVTAINIETLTNSQITTIQVNIPIPKMVLNDNGDYIPRGSIEINGNYEFNETNGVTGGSGTEEDPYILEDWKLTEITIRDTTAYFIVRNCYLTEVDEYPYENFGGVRLNNVVNGAIQDSIFYPEGDCNAPGIHLESSNNNVVDSCMISNCWFGIRLDTSSANIIKNCNISYIDNGIWLDTSNDNVIDNCNIFNIGTWSAIVLSVSNNNMIHNCTISTCEREGIKLSYSNYNNISNCEILKCQLGIDLGGSSYNVIHSCNVSECFDGGGIDVSKSRDIISEGNIIYHNNFFKNYFLTDPNIRLNARVDSKDCLNQWDNGDEGNYWDDYIGLKFPKLFDKNGDGIGDTPYRILTGARPLILRGRPTGNKDRYPLMGLYPDGGSTSYHSQQQHSTPSSSPTNIY